MSETLPVNHVSSGNADATGTAPADAFTSAYANARKLVVGNWKMHGSLASNTPLLRGVADAIAALPATVKVGVCVPFPYLAQAEAELQGSVLGWGVQDISGHVGDKGAYTGDVSADMACDFGATLTIVGHSERRAYHHERDVDVVDKTRLALAAGLTPVVCVGETLDQREQGATQAVVGAQLNAVLDALDVAGLAQIVVAYEPVWAIGTGKSASAEQAQAVHAFLREQLKRRDPSLASVKLLYGGSVKPGNAVELFGQADIDGGLIGGAALVAADFIAICAAAVS